MEKIDNSLAKSLVVDNIDIVNDYIELGIDSMIDNELYKGIPVVDTIGSLVKCGITIHEYKLTRNLAIFIKELNNGDIDKEKLEKYKEKILNNPKKLKREMGRILLLLDETIDDEKSNMIGKLFKAFINETINWNEFCEFTEVVRRLFVQDIGLLECIYHGGVARAKIAKEMYKMDRINSLGITGTSPKMFDASEEEIKNTLFVVPNKVGKKFMNIIFMNYDYGGNDE